MTLFLEDRGWVIDFVERPAKLEPRSPIAHHPMPTDRDVDQKSRGGAVEMTFEGDARLPLNVGENKLEGHHNYFLGDDESRWRTGVPLYGSVRYEDLYPGIDLLLVHIPLNPDLYTIIAMGGPNSKEFTNFRGSLDSKGLATTSFHVPTGLPFGFSFHHAYLVHDASGRIHMASDAVPVRLE